MENRNEELEFIKQIAQLYLDHVVLYRRQLNNEEKLNQQAQEKMRQMLDDFVVKLEEHLTKIAKIQKAIIQIEQGLALSQTMSIAKEYSNVQEQFVEIQKQFDRLAGTTEQLSEIKKRIDSKIRFTHSRRKNASTLSFATQEASLGPVQASKEVLKDKWVDNLLSNLASKDSKLQKLSSFQSKMKNSGDSKKVNETRESKSYTSIRDKSFINTRDMTKYLRAFKTIQEEFMTLKSVIRNVKQEQKSHRHIELEAQMEKINTETLKIEADNSVMMKEHSELFHKLHLLTRRVETMERDNEDMKRLLGDITNAKSGYKTHESSAQKIVAERTSSRKSETNFPDWVLTRLNK